MNEGPVQVQVTTLDHSDYVGRIGIGRVYRGTLDTKTPIKVIKQAGGEANKQIKQLFTFDRKKSPELPHLSLVHLDKAF